MSLIDERFKDAAPEKTVEKIINILTAYGISVTETPGNSGLKSCHSHQLFIKGAGAGSNGKGVTPTLSRASAYAELMERLQSGRLGSGKTEFADTVNFDKDTLLTHCADYFEAIAKSHPKSNGKTATADELAELCILTDGGENAEMLPYYNATKGEMTYFPTALTKLYSTTGLAAGNSVEEALVQGLSEILERNSKLRIMREKLVPPEIPEEYLRQFPETYATIEEIRNAGYDVIIKDCSLGKPFPVLSAVLINKNSHCYHVHMGCHPIFEIALRRTLTETFQGRTLANVTDISTLISSDEYKATGTEIVKNMSSSKGAYPVEYFGKDFSFEFVPFKDRTGMNNKELLREIMEYIEGLGYSMLFRNHSSLGFPTYRILIPGYSETRPYWIESGMSLATAQTFYDSFDEKYTEISRERASFRIGIERLLLKLNGHDRFSVRFAPSLSIDRKTDFALYYLNIAYLEWAAKNKANALTYVSEVCKSAPDFDSEYLHCLKSWISFDVKGYSHEKVRFALEPFYNCETLDEVSDAILGGNPFAKYAHDCSEAGCNGCKYRDNCIEDKKRELKEKVNDAIRAFDDAAAFEQLKLFFKELR